MLLLALFFLFPFSIKSCNHDSLDFTVEILPDTHYEKRLSTNALVEFQNSTRQSIRIYPLYFLDGAPEKAKAVIQDYLIPAAINYFQATLKVDRTGENIKVPSDTMCGVVQTPSFIKTDGVDADLILLITADPESADSYLATAKACNLIALDERPGVGVINFNYNQIHVDSAVSLERHILTTLHEITHILGFSWNLYQYFRDPVTGGRVTTSPVQSKIINGINTSFLTVEPLVTRLQDYFGCSSIEGAYLENQGNGNSGLSHFERRIFYNEVMTASDIDDAKISEFTLAVLEGSGWYTVDYSKTEPLFWGKNEGCSFLDSSCINPTTKKTAFDEFCGTLTQKGCTFTGRSQGFCGVESTVTLPSTSTTTTASDSLSQLFEGRSPVIDTYADNCPYFVGYTNRDCRNSANQKDRRDENEIYGDNSRCFTGNLWVPKEAGESVPYCFESECEINTNGKYKLKVKIGRRKITCSKEERFSLTGFVGFFDCPDPDAFCTTQGLEFCPRGCMGKGSCVNQKCVCDEGWEGLDCSFQPGVLNKILTMDDKSNERTLIIIIVGCCLGGFAILVIGCLLYKHYRKKGDDSDKRASYIRRKSTSKVYPLNLPSKSLMTIIPEEGANSKVSSITFD